MTLSKKLLAITVGAILLSGGVSLLSGAAHAQGIYDDESLGMNGFVPLAKYPVNSRLGGIYESNGDLGVFVNNLFTFAISLGAILAVLRLAYAGYIYLVSGLQWTERTKAREIIGDTVLGLLLLLAIFLILKQINPDLLKLNVLDQLKQLPKPAQEDPGLQTSLQLQEQHVGDMVTNPQEYMPSLSTKPIPGYYCFTKALTGGSGYSCVTNQANCDRLAQSEGKTCALTP